MKTALFALTMMTNLTQLSFASDCTVYLESPNGSFSCQGGCGGQAIRYEKALNKALRARGYGPGISPEGSRFVLRSELKSYTDEGNKDDLIVDLTLFDQKSGYAYEVKGIKQFYRPNGSFLSMFNIEKDVITGEKAAIKKGIAKLITCEEWETAPRN